MDLILGNGLGNRMPYFCPSHFSPEAKWGKLLELTKSYQGAFTWAEPDISLKCKVLLNTRATTRRHTKRRIVKHFLEDIDEITKGMLEIETISQSSFHLSSPVLIVKRQHGNLMWTAYGRLNVVKTEGSISILRTHKILLTRAALWFVCISDLAADYGELQDTWMFEPSELMHFRQLLPMANNISSKNQCFGWFQRLMHMLGELTIYNCFF